MVAKTIKLLVCDARLVEKEKNLSTKERKKYKQQISSSFFFSLSLNHSPYILSSITRMVVNIAISTESRRTVLRKLGIFGSIAIGLFIVGKKHIAYQKQARHDKESDSSIKHEINQQEEEFGYVTKRRGFPLTNPNLDYTSPDRQSKYVGSGDAFSSRRQGDRLSLFQVIKAKWLSDEAEESKYYTPSREDKLDK